MFSTLSRTNIATVATLKLSSANALNLDKSDSLSFGKELSNMYVVGTWIGDQVIACYIWWQRWDNDRGQTGGALSMLYSPGLLVYKSHG